MDDETLSEDSNLLSGTSSQINIITDLHSLNVAIESLEMEKRQMSIKRDQHRGKTLEQATKLRKLIDEHRVTLDKLSSEYNYLGDQSASLSQISRLKQIDEASSILQKRLDEKRELAQQKSDILRETQSLIAFIQQKREERDRLYNESTSMDDRIDKTKQKITKLKSQVSLNLTRIDMLTQSSHDDIEILSVNQAQLIMTIQKDGQRMQQLRKNYQDMEEIHKNNIKRQTKTMANNKEQRVRCQNLRSKMSIIESDLMQVDDALEQFALNQTNNESIIASLHEGIIHLRKFKEELETTNHKIKNQCKQMWGRYKSTLLQLEEIEEELIKNSEATHSLCSFYQNSINS